MKMLKSDDVLFRKYPVLKPLFDSGWMFMLDEYDDPHHGRPEADYYARSPRMEKDGKFSIWMGKFNGGDSLETIMDREARTVARDYTRIKLPDVEAQMFMTLLTHFRTNASEKPTVKVSVTIE